MDSIQQFFSSLTVNQLALAFGALTFIVHSIINYNDRLSKPLNLFIVRFTSIVVPILTVLATDPNVYGFVHAYFPALIAYFAAYQGLYHAVKAVKEKADSLKELAKPADQVV